MLPSLLLALTPYMCSTIHINFGANIVLNGPYFGRIQINFKDTHREKKYPKVKFQHFWKAWIWTFGWLVHQINSVHEVTKLKQNFWKRKVVTGKTPFFVIGQFCTPHSICLNIGFWQSSFVRKCFVVNLSTFNFFRKFISKLKYWNRSKFPVIVT